MGKSLIEIIENNSRILNAGNSIKVLFEDGLATIFKDKGEIITLLEEVDYRLGCSIHDYRK